MTLPCYDRNVQPPEGVRSERVRPLDSPEGEERPEEQGEAAPAPFTADPEGEGGGAVLGVHTYSG